MHLTQIEIANFRLLNDCILKLNPDKKQDLSLLIGKNNTGKTSFIVLFDKFLRPSISPFTFNDFSMDLREKILSVEKKSNLSDCQIQMKWIITYDITDNLENISEFILDLDPNEFTVKILFECQIEGESLSKDLKDIKRKHKKKFIENNIGNYLSLKYYIYTDDNDLLEVNRHKLHEKKIQDINKVVNYQVIHAKRNVSSSESSGRSNPLSQITTTYFESENDIGHENFGKINDTILAIDKTLNQTYNEYFKEYFEKVKHFVDGQLSIISNLESKQILSNYSKVVYGNPETYLPENFNGLGHLNILFLLLQIEIKKKFFEKGNKDLNLLFIEEPEAHTHPQMQYIFATKIKSILSEIGNLQAFITSHSSHIVSQCDFEDIRYFKNTPKGIKIKNFHNELEEKYKSEPEQFKFLKQYLNLYSAELFFADKIIFLEGISEKILFPYFINKFDDSMKSNKNYIPLTSQNISFIQAGANARVFRHFIDFLGIKTLILTDIDGTNIQPTKKQSHAWKKCSTVDAANTSNITLKHFYSAPKIPKIAEIQSTTDSELWKEYCNWFNKLKSNDLPSVDSNIFIAYQTEENSYHARSFEDAFLNVNYDLVLNSKDRISGLKNKSQLNENSRNNLYHTARNTIKDDGKSYFASSILYLALVENIEWKTPKYINEGLKWIAQ